MTEANLCEGEGGDEQGGERGGGEGDRNVLIPWSLFLTMAACMILKVCWQCLICS